MQKKIVHIKGMHCKACEILVSDELLAIPQVQEVTVDQSTGTAELFCTSSVNQTSIKKAVQNAGYSLGTEEVKPWFVTTIRSYGEIALMGCILLVGYLLFQKSNVGTFFSVGSNNFASIPVVFLIGLTAGVSTCAALVGGLVLGASAKYSKQHPEASTVQKFVPHLFFNLGRVLSFVVFGAVVGLIGSAFQITLGVTGFLSILVGLVMLVLGAQLTQLFPRLSTISISLPSSVSRLVGLRNQSAKQYSHQNAFLLGALTFFLPCGFTQMVQLYAISTGNPVQAAVTMGTFALGTTPGLLGIAGFTSFVKGSFATTFFKFSGVVVVFLAIFNISNGINLTGLKQGFMVSSRTQNSTQGAEHKNAQILKTTFTNAKDIQPNTFTVHVGQPVRMEVDVRDEGSGCMGSFTIPGLSKQVDMLQKGKTLVYEFTPSKKGTYDITCAMGVPRGSISVL
ncbi:hypothetical protein HGA88_05030 [Candidatus Roizmanbacteria bacterium]|nr:hypothetical protein [Candidatus Roizmanbacteria bacterium]